MTRKEIIDFEEFGLHTVLETRDQASAERICGLELRAYANGLKPAISTLESGILRARNRRESLCAHLYDRPVPVNDARMLAHKAEYLVYFALLLVACAASIIGHISTFLLFGLGIFLSAAIGVTLTAIITAIGYRAFEKFLLRYKSLEMAMIAAALVLCFWGVWQLAVARGSMVDAATASSSSPASYVDDDASSAPTATASSEGDQSLEQKVRQMLGSASAKIMFAADLVLGILLGLVVNVRKDADYAAWQQLGRLAKKQARLERQREELLASIEMAKERCMAGILHGIAILNKRHPPYHSMLPFLIIGIVLASGPRLHAQTAKSEEVILLDTSASISTGTANHNLFHEYLRGTERLLSSERPESHVWVLSITAHSFGDTGVVLSGWTPEVQGVFTDTLIRTRRQLTQAFATRSLAMTPNSKGTDIIGGLWRARDLMESADSPSGAPRTIWIFSDMMNETAALPMPALLNDGPERMLDEARAKKLIVPLKGYRVSVLGASPSGLDPQAWNTVRAFWELYFREAGAEMVEYSPECTVVRQ